eukprot:3660703-Prymnesium_polylepis.1
MWCVRRVASCRAPCAQGCVIRGLGSTFPGVSSALAACYDLGCGLAVRVRVSCPGYPKPPRKTSLHARRSTH